MPDSNDELDNGGYKNKTAQSGMTCSPVHSHRYSRYTVIPPQLIELYHIPLYNTHIQHNHAMEYTDTIMEYSVHNIPPSMLRRDLCNVLPDFNLLNKSTQLHSIVTIQYSQYELTEFTTDNEHEKNKLLQSFYRWALSVCHILLSYNKTHHRHSSAANTLAGRYLPIKSCCNVYNNNKHHTHSSDNTDCAMDINHRVSNAYLDQLLTNSDKWYHNDEIKRDTMNDETIPSNQLIYADFIDPCTGLPVLSTPSGTIYSEVDGIQQLLRYRIDSIGQCNILYHPSWYTRCYPASIFTTASLQQIQYAIQKTNQLFGGTVCNYTTVLHQQ